MTFNYLTESEFCLLCFCPLDSLSLLECAKLRGHFDFCVVEQFINGQYLNARKVFIPAWGMVKTCFECLCYHVACWLFQCDIDTDSCLLSLFFFNEAADMEIFAISLLDALR